jgi:hypothetical protein
MLLALLKALPIGLQIGLALAVLAAAGGGYYAWRSSIFDKGVAYQQEQQKESDDHAVERAQRGIKNVDDCVSAGGAWDQAAGVCR